MPLATPVPPETLDRRTTPWSWLAPYHPGGSRDLRFDFLRGFAVLAMVVDHLGGPSWLYALTGGNRFYTSAAEGFIFISGLLVGLVYGRIVRRDGFRAGMLKAFERAGVLYLLTIGVTLPLIVLSEGLGLSWATGLPLEDPVHLVLQVLTLHRTYYLIDVMVLYTLLLALAPLALWLLVQGRTWLVLTGSWGLWAAFQLVPDLADVPWSIDGNYLFYFAAWQVFFFTAVTIGYHRDRVATWFSPRVQRGLLALSAVGFVGLLVLYRLGDSLWLWLIGKNPAFVDPDHVLLLLFGKGDVRPGRVLASLVVFGFLFLLVTYAWRPLYRALGWLLMPLGQNALYAYAAHIVLVVLVAIVALPWGGVGGHGRWLNTLLQVGGVLALWALIRGHVLFPSARLRVPWALVPATGAVVALLVLPAWSLTQASASEPAADAPNERRSANAFGTPIPKDGSGAPPAFAAPGSASKSRRGANAFGTPVPAGAGVPTPPDLAAEASLPEPRRSAKTSTDPGHNVLPEYVGEIRGRFLEQSFYSRALEAEMDYYIYLPAEYDQVARAYPVLYLLHGASGDAAEWPVYGFIDMLDQSIAAREIEPFIVVLPQGQFGYWINHAGDGPRWGDYLTQDVVKHVDSTYRTLRRPQRRAIGGLSMGGAGALVQAFQHPDVFGVLGAHGPSLREDNRQVPFLGTGADFAARDPVSLAKTATDLDRILIMLDTGEEDPWYERTRLLHGILEAQELEPDFQIWPGGHDGDYWSSHTPEYLRFYSYALYAR